MYTCRSSGSALPIRFSAAIADTCQHAASAKAPNGRETERERHRDQNVTSTSSRSPPMSWFGRFADW